MPSNPIRIIPVLLLRDWGVEKSIRFKDFVYIGCPINAARVFSGFNVDELVLLDINATPEKRLAQTEIVRQIAEESNMPLSVGGGVKTLQDIRELLKAGADRVIINTRAVESPAVVKAGADSFGQQCMVVSVDVGINKAGKEEVFICGGKKATGLDPVRHAVNMQKLGAGEILLNSIPKDGTLIGYDTALIRRVADAVSIPVIACGGAGTANDFAAALDVGHASAVAAGAMFLFFGPRRTVLINYPKDAELISALGPERVRPKDVIAAPPSGYL